MYESPIELFSMTEYAKHIDEQIEKTVYEAVTKVGINVNREELIRALQYDRNQYEKGYADGKKDGVEWHPYPKEKPTKEGNYLVTAKYEKEEAYVTTSVFIVGYNTFCGGRFVTAWAELPIPYKEGAEE